MEKFLRKKSLNVKINSWKKKIIKAIWYWRNKKSLKEVWTNNKYTRIKAKDKRARIERKTDQTLKLVINQT